MATEAETLEFRLKADIANFKKGMKEADDKIDKTAKKAKKANGKIQKAFQDSASAVAAFQGPLGPLSGRMNAMGAAIGRAGAIVTGLGIGMVGVTIALKKALAAASAFNREFNRLEGIIKATGGAAQLSASEVNRFAQKLGENTLTSASAAREAAGIVLTFKSITGDTFKETLKLAQDMSESGFGALKQTSLQLAKALEEPVIGLNALRRSGVSFTDTQKDMIKGMVEAGDKASAQKMILKAVNEQVGGAGVAAAQGLAGAMDTLGERVTRAWEAIGNTAPVKGAAAAISFLSDAVNSFIQPLENANFMQAQMKDLIEPNIALLEAMGMSVKDFDTDSIILFEARLRKVKEAGIDLKANLPFGELQKDILAAEARMLGTAAKMEMLRGLGGNLGTAIEGLSGMYERQVLVLDDLSKQLADVATADLEAEQAANAAAAAKQQQIDGEKAYKDAIKANEKATDKMEKALQKIIDKADPMSAAITEQTNLVNFYSDQLESGAINAERFHLAMVAISEVGPVAGATEDDKEDPLTKLQEQAAEKLAALDEQFATEEEQLAIHMGNNLQIIQEGLDANVISEADAAKRREKVVNDFHKSKKKLDQTAFKATMGAASSLASGLMSISSSGNKSLFKAAKTASLAIAGINMWQGVSEGVALGWPKAIPAVAYALGTGLKAISSIQGASFGGGGGGGGGGAGGGGGGGAATTATPTAAVAPTTIQPQAAAVGQKVEINLGDEDGLVSKNTIRAIIDGINDQIADGAAIQSITVV